MSQTIGDLTLRFIIETAGAKSKVYEVGRTIKTTAETADKSRKTFVALSDTLQNIGLRVQGVQGLFAAFRATLGQLVREYNASAVATSKLENGLRNIGESTAAVSQLIEQANSLQTITPFADEEIVNAQAMLTTFQKSTDEIEILTPRILDLAASYMKSGDAGMDLQQVAVMLGKVNEETVGQLRRVGVAFSNEQAEKLKSLKGTEQAIYLSEILDQNFKGMAATVGQTAAGQMKIFQNRTSDLREALGKLVSDALVPLLNLVTPIIQSLANGGPVVQRFTLSLIALATAAALLNTAFGYWPYIIGGVIAAMYSLSGAFETTEAQIADFNQATLESQDVNESMKGILGDLKISADNMADAYKNIGDAIALMSREQLDSARLFILSEKAKIQALIESQKQMRLNELANIDFVPPDQGKSIENTLKLGFGADLAEFDKLLSQIESKLKYIGNNNKPDGNNGKNNKSLTTGDKTEQLNQEIKLLEEIDKVEKKIAANAGNVGALKDLNEELRELRNELQYVRTGIEVYDFAEQLEGVSRSREDMLTGMKETAETYVEENKKAIEEVDRLKIESIKDETKRKRAQLQLERKLAIEDINSRNINPAIKKELISLTNRKYNQEDPNDKTEQLFSQSLSFASQISSVLGIGAETFVGQLLSGLQQGLSLANSFASLLSAVLNIAGGGGIFSLLGFAGGGSVPGTGSGDTVPAMLTPGEFVVKKGVVNKIGTGFFEWINGGGLFSSIAGKYASGGLVTQQASAPAQVYIINPKLRGNDIELALKRTNKINSRRLT